MTPAIPHDAKRVVLAAVVPCERCKGTGCDELTVADYEAAGIDIDLDDDDLGSPEYAFDCSDCDGIGTRTVVTDIEVEQRESPWMVVGYDNPEGPSIVGRRDGWYPVEAEHPPSTPA